MPDLRLPSPKDALHKAWLYRTLSRIADDAFLARSLAFKGGTCAAMLGYLDRFSVDLDLDCLASSEEIPEIRTALMRAFTDLGLVVSSESKVVPQYLLKYPAPAVGRNTIKIDVTLPPPRANMYESKRLDAIDRIVTCQTLPTMVANKFVAPLDRFARNASVAGRDLYDIHHFLLKGYAYDSAVITERTAKTPKEFFEELIAFVDTRMTETTITQDINILLPYPEFSRIRKTLKQETIMLLRDERDRAAS